MKKLTATESEILTALTRGLSNKEIARERGSSEQTIKNQLHVIFIKINAKNRTQAAIWAATAREEDKEGSEAWAELFW